MDIIVSGTEQLIDGMTNRASLICSIKAISPPINYGGEPSGSIGIVSQLPSSHLSIHRVPAKLSNRVMPYGMYSCRLRLLFIVLLLTGCLLAALIFQWTRCCHWSYLTVGSDAVCYHAIIYGFLFQDPARPPIRSVTRQGSGRYDSFSYRFLIMLPVLLPAPDNGYLSASFPDHTLVLSAGSKRRSLRSYRQ